MALYPNPANDEVQLTYTLPASSVTAMLVLTDLLGRPVRTQELAAGSTHATLPVRELAAGLYQLQLVVDGQVQTTRKLAVAR